MRIDARIPLRFGPFDSLQAGEVMLTDRIEHAATAAAFLGADAPGHVVGCLCCTPRTAAASCLAELFRARALGQGPLFRGVLAVMSEAGQGAVLAALDRDPVVSGRFRLA